MYSNKTIIFCAPSDYGLSNSIKETLEMEGFKVFFFSVSDTPYKYKNFQERLYNTFRKVFLKDFNYKRQLKMQQRLKELNSILKNTPSSHYGFIIRPDLFPEEFIQSIKLKSQKLVGYQWDGLERFPSIFNYFQYFDRFFAFDPKDIHKHSKVLPITNFYIDNYTTSTYSQMAYFLGSFDSYRFNIIKTLKEVLERFNIPTNFLFVTKDEKEKKRLKEAGFVIPEPLDYKKNIHNVQNSSIVIDIHVPIHSGLSFRTFEALYYNKKLITTNNTIKYYDFYHPNNILIWDNTSEKDIREFLQLDFIEIPKLIKEKYSFKNWISYILDSGDYIPIDLPEIY